ncbi:2-aminobenzoate-CoA ligase OS=Streptomyces microflavus OX=1919 GN=Smic_64760 PE=4 SV=1 [Streptomyces microflavus]
MPGWQARGGRTSTASELPDGEPGLLAVRGPVGCRYLADPRQTEYVRHGWNITGDTFVREPDGYFRYVARADDMIISSGYNIAGPEVEDALLRHPEVVGGGRGGPVGRTARRDRGGPRGADAGVEQTADALRARHEGQPRARTSARATSPSGQSLPRTATGKLASGSSLPMVTGTDPTT